MNLHWQKQGLYRLHTTKLAAKCLLRPQWPELEIISRNRILNLNCVQNPNRSLFDRPFIWHNSSIDMPPAKRGSKFTSKTKMPEPKSTAKSKVSPRPGTRTRDQSKSASTIKSHSRDDSHRNPGSSHRPMSAYKEDRQTRFHELAAQWNVMPDYQKAAFKALADKANSSSMADAGSSL